MEGIVTLFLITSLSFLPIVSLIECNETSSTFVHEDQVRHTSQKDGHYIIQSIQSITEGGSCDVVTLDGLLRTYAVKYALRNIMLDESILPRIELGYKIEDTCVSLPITMARGIEISNDYRQRVCYEENKGQCSSGQTSSLKPVIAVIGTFYSFTTIPLASLLSFHNITQISFSASSPLLSKINDYPSYFRTIPPDTYQVEAMIDIITHFNWTYVFAVGSDDHYGKLAITELKKLAATKGICVTGDVYIPYETTSTKQVAGQVAAKIEKEPRAIVVIMFNYAKGMGEYVLKEAEKLNLKRIWLTSEAWNPEALSITDLPERQLLSIVTISWKNGKSIQDFENYIHSVIRNEVMCDVWLSIYIQQMFNCTITSSRNETLNGQHCKGSICTPCSVNASDVFSKFLNGSPSQINNLIDAVRAVGYAIDAAAKFRCPNSTCIQGLLPEDVTEAMKSVNFTNERNVTVAFDSNGNPTYVSYSIEQIQKSNKEIKYVVIGDWNKKSPEKLQKYTKAMQWPPWSSNQIPRSSCSIDCQPGEFVVGKQGCCWECRKCPSNSISSDKNADNCSTCPSDYYAVNNRVCVKRLIVYLGLKDAVGIIALSLSAIGASLTLLTLVMFVSLRSSSVIQESSMVVSLFSFTLLFASFGYTGLIIVRPTQFTCQFQNAYFHLVLMVFNVFLLVKNNSTVQFLSKLRHKKEDEQIIRVIVFVLIILTQVGLLVVWMCRKGIKIELLATSFQYFQQCNIQFSGFRIAAFAFPCIILLAATIQSSSERNMNYRHREAKFVYFTCLSLCMISLAYIITFTQVVGEYQAMVFLFTIVAYGFAYIGCMVIPKLFIALQTPEPKQEQANGTLNIGCESYSSNNILENAKIFGQASKVQPVITLTNYEVDVLN